MSHAAKLVSSGLHPNKVIEGYGMATDACLDYLKRVSRTAIADRSTVERIIRTSLMTKLNRKGIPQLARLLTEAIFRAGGNLTVLGAIDVQSINIVGLAAGFDRRAELIDGILLDSAPATAGMPNHLDSARVAIVNSLELEDFPYDITVVLPRPDSLARMVEEETSILDEFVAKLEEMQANFIACRGGIDDQVERKLAHEGILAVKNLKDEEIRMVERATAGKLVSFSDLSQSDLGMAEKIEWKGKAKGGMVLGGMARGTSSIVLRRGNKVLLDEDIAAVKTSIRLVSHFLDERRVVAGGGAVDAELRSALKEAAKPIRTRERLAIDAFGEALMATSHALAENAGLDPVKAIGALISAHNLGRAGACLNLRHGGVVDAFRAGLIEPLALKRQAIISASEAVQTLLKCDEVLASIKH